jgi:N-acetylneuraminate synthase
MPVITEQQKVFIIAEAGVNHNGSLEMAKQLVDAAVDAGVDAVKFQTFKSEKLVSKSAPKAEYQTKTTDSSESQFEMIKKLELDEEAHQVLIEYCAQKGVQFLSTPFDTDSVDLLARRFDLPRLKVPSGEITNAPLLLKVASTGKPIILSTGMSTLGEIELALGVIAFGYLQTGQQPSVNAFEAAYCSAEGQKLLQAKVVLLHCTTEYPAPFTDVNLMAMDTLRSTFGLPVGFSDHTVGISIPIAAVARGAVIVEKHFTLDRNLPGPDHKASLEPNELKAMVKGIREVEQALGVPRKMPAISELKNKPIARKSIVASRKIQKGEPFTDQNITIKRPGTGVSPIHYWDYIGKLADKDYLSDEVIQ